MGMLVDSLDLMNGKDDDGEPMELLNPKYTFNPALQRFYQCVERRALDPSAPIGELDPVISKYVEPDKDLMKKAEPAFQAIRQSFKFEKVVIEKKQQKR